MFLYNIFHLYMSIYTFFSFLLSLWEWLVNKTIPFSMVEKRDLTLSGEDRVQYADDVL